jgi:hypothetical protein
MKGVFSPMVILITYKMHPTSSQSFENGRWPVDTSQKSLRKIDTAQKDLCSCRRGDKRKLEIMSFSCSLAQQNTIHLRDQLKFPAPTATADHTLLSLTSP